MVELLTERAIANVGRDLSVDLPDAVFLGEQSHVRHELRSASATRPLRV
jgi:hypothetical protein